MEQPQNRYHQDLPPPPPAHQHPGQAPSSQFAYQQSRRPSQPQQQYYQQPSSPQEYQPPSPQEYQLSSQSSQPRYQQQPSQQQQQQQQQPPPSQHSHTKTKSRSFSFHSDKNRKRSTSKSEETHETAADKEARRFSSKADPSLAISEAEPAVIAAMTEYRLAPLRDMQHKDPYGNPIADPDRSNPTRNRWERPLDTIRSFEAAIDGAYSRKSIVRAETDSVAGWNRRSSYHPGGQPRFRPDSYYGSSRPQSLRPEQAPYGLGVAPPVAPSVDRAQRRSSMFDASRGQYDDYTGSHFPGPVRQAVPRTNTEPYRHFGRDPNVYHLAHKDRSYETVTSAEGSGQSDQIGYQTDPTSSDNSSIERHSPARRPEPKTDYGIGFSQPQSFQNLSLGGNQANRGPPPPPHGSVQQGGRPAVPRKEVPGVLKRQSQQAQQQPPQQKQDRPAAPEKRKSWLARRFSKGK